LERRHIVNVFDILWLYHREFLVGLVVTLKLAFSVWGLGIAAGLALGVAGARSRRLVGIPSRVASSVFSGIPILVFLFWLHYPLQSILGIVVDPFYTAVAALSLVNTVLVADVVRNTLTDFPTQYVWAAKVCGLSPRDTMLRIQLPIIFRQIVPGLLLIQVSMLQATLFASLISVDEVFRIAQRINSQVYRPVEIYSALAVFFLAVCMPLNGAAYLMRSRFSRDLSER
jgi:polar amino acid transport system permease protein